MAELTACTLVVVDPCDLEGPLTVTWGEFIGSNDFAADELAAMRATLEAGETYEGGGGAAGVFTVRLPAASVARTAGAAIETAYPFGYRSEDREP